MQICSVEVLKLTVMIFALQCALWQFNCYDFCFTVCIMAVQFISDAEKSVMTVFSLLPMLERTVCSYKVYNLFFM